MLNLFDPTLYKEHKVLASIGIQEHYLFAKGKRCDASCKMLEYRLIDINEGGVMSGKTLVNPAETPVNSGKTPVNPEISAQRKEKKSIVENSIEKKNAAAAVARACESDKISKPLNSENPDNVNGAKEVPTSRKETFAERCAKHQEELLADTEWQNSLIFYERKAYLA